MCSNLCLNVLNTLLIWYKCDVFYYYDYYYSYGWTPVSELSYFKVFQIYYVLQRTTYSFLLENILTCTNII